MADPTTEDPAIEISPVLFGDALNWNPLLAIMSSLVAWNEESLAAVVVIENAAKLCVAKSSRPASVTSSAVPSRVSMPPIGILLFPLLLTRACTEVGVAPELSTIS